MGRIPTKFDRVSIVDGGSDIPDSVTFEVEQLGRTTRFTIAGIIPEKIEVPEKVPEGQPWTISFTTLDGAPIIISLNALAPFSM